MGKKVDENLRMMEHWTASRLGSRLATEIMRMHMIPALRTVYAFGTQGGRESCPQWEWETRWMRNKERTRHAAKNVCHRP